MGGRTTAKFNEQLRLNGHIAYGTLDKRFKYEAAFFICPIKNPRRHGGNYRYEIEQLGNSPNAFREDFLFAALFRRNPADKLSLTEEYKFYYEHEWFNGFSNKLNFRFKEILPLQENAVRIINSEGETVSQDKIITTEPQAFEARFAFNEKFILGDFDRVSVGTKYPILGIEYSYGIPVLLAASMNIIG
ncbi:MAG: hypothetical protein R2759_17160 [Bacteroidales bacterium]